MSMFLPGTPAQKKIYQPDLTARLRGDHVDLIKDLTAIVQAANDGNFAGVNRLLGPFQGALQSHFRLKYGSLYQALGRALDESMAKEASLHKQDIVAIGSTVVDILEHYIQSEVSEDTLLGFLEDMGDLRDQLTIRIEREEAVLYPLYDSSFGGTA